MHTQKPMPQFSCVTCTYILHLIYYAVDMIVSRAHLTYYAVEMYVCGAHFIYYAVETYVSGAH